MAPKCSQSLPWQVHSTYFCFQNESKHYGVPLPAASWALFLIYIFDYFPLKNPYRDSFFYGVAFCTITVELESLRFIVSALFKTVGLQSILKADFYLCGYIWLLGLSSTASNVSRKSCREWATRWPGIWGSPPTTPSSALLLLHRLTNTFNLDVDNLLHTVKVLLGLFPADLHRDHFCLITLK